MLPTTREDEDSRPGNAGTGTPSTLPLRNHLLNSVAPADLEPLRPHLLGHPVEIAQDEVLHRRGEPVVHVFFPEKGLVSLTADTMDGGGSAEVAMTGREGLVGAAVLLDPEAIATHEAVVQIPGTAWRIPAQVLCAAVERSPALRERLLRYVQFLMVQTGQAAACNARHSLSRRLARWLLMAHDRVDGDELALRQEAVSLMLGVRREGVNLAAHALQDGGLIRQARGRITVLDRPGLEAAACGCYRAVRDGEVRILGLASD